MKHIARIRAIVIERLEPRRHLSGSGLVHTVATLSHNTQEDVPATVAGSVVLFVDGLNSLDIYNFKTGLWSTARIKHVGGGGSSAVSIGNKALFAGGSYQAGDEYFATDLVQIYNARTNKWSTAHLSQPRDNMTAIAVGDKALFVGGAVDNNPVASNVVDIYDASAGKWSSTTLSFTAAFISATAVDGQALFTDGDHVDIYNAATGQWSTATLSQARLHVAVTSVGNLAIFAGGDNALTGSFLDTVDIYDAATGQWSTASLSQAHDVGSTATVDGMAVFAGGFNTVVGDSNAVDVYSLTANRWTAAALALGEDDMAATALGNEAIFAGGVVDLGSVYDGVETYDSGSGQWSSATLSQARYRVSAVTAGSTALFAGGSLGAASDTQSDTVDLFTSPWLRVILSRPRRGQVTVTLANTGSSALPASAELTIFASPTSNLEGNGIQLGHIVLANPLAALATEQVSVPVAFPPGAPAGNYHLIATLGPSHERVQVASTRHTFALGTTPALARPALALGIFNATTPINPFTDSVWNAASFGEPSILI